MITANHYVEEGTYHTIEQRYYWSGMRSSFASYVKKCTECARHKSTCLKPAGSLRKPVQPQRSETLSIDLSGPLPEGPEANVGYSSLKTVQPDE
ncbi:hypothetical protein AVEN_34353-1 [Araneus ventricosus]|uniref:Integrase zinc-binding domain-containing protein n=1 Tax=Araneus ventricosus TaxID=182803 RepID=A0A4Y2G337_ARAVE|nr:hypothetical protein AVEN_34353-1 [Araneus ventricosus]